MGPIEPLGMRAALRVRRAVAGAASVTREPHGPVALALSVPWQPRTPETAFHAHAARWSASEKPADSGSGASADSGSSESTEGAASASASSSSSSAPNSSILSKARTWAEFTKDVVLGVFGVESPRAAATDEGADKYPWVEYPGPEGKQLYRNTRTGMITEEKPVDFDLYGAAIEVDSSTVALAIVKQKKTRWQYYADILSESPLMQAVTTMQRRVMESDAARRLQERREDIQREWETSQNPLVYSAASAYDRLFGETEQARAIARIQQLDPAFTGGPEFLDELRDEILPGIVGPFLRGARRELQGWCTDDCLARINAVLRAREAEGITAESTLLSVSQLNMIGAKMVDKGEPIVLVSGMVQQIHCLRNKKVRVDHPPSLSPLSSWAAIAILYPLRRPASLGFGRPLRSRRRRTQAAPRDTGPVKCPTFKYRATETAASRTPPDP